MGCEEEANANGTAQGPLVGEKRSSHAITEEYAKADPIYVAKTIVSISASCLVVMLTFGKALPQTYSHYRSILGDGNCGWRGKFTPMAMLLRAFHKIYTPLQMLHHFQC